MANKRQKKKKNAAINANKEIIKRQQQEIKSNTAHKKENAAIKKSNNATKKQNREKIKANKEAIGFSQHRAKEFRSMMKVSGSLEYAGKQFGGKSTKAGRELKQIGNKLGGALEKAFLAEQAENVKLLREQNKLLREQNKALTAQNKELTQYNKALTENSKMLRESNKDLREDNKYMRAEEKAKNYDWYKDDELDNIQQHLAIKKYHEWVKAGLIREASVLDKYQYVKYLEDVASPEMLQELVDEYEPTLQRVLENDRKRREASPVINWSELWG